MTVFILIVFILCLAGIKIVRPVLSGFNDNYLSPNRTDFIKGIFVLLVFLSHSRNYLSEFSAYSSDPINDIYNVIQDHLGQGIVVMFLFYSGYGVMESIKRKGADYINSFPKKRIAKTLFNFDIAVLLFVVVDMFIGSLKNYTVSHVFLSFIGWESIGNSNWYIFAVLVLYLFTYISFKVFKVKYSKAIALVTFFTVLYIAILALVKDAWWFDTVLLYPLGMWYSLGKNNIEKFIEKKPVNYFSLLLLCIAIFIISHILRKNIICYELSQVSLCAVIVAVTMKLVIGNRVLEFFGKHLFEFYILMRIPMLILKHYDITNTYVFVVISFVSTVMMMVVFKKLLVFLDSKIFVK